MLKSNMAATQKVSWSLFTDFSDYIFNIVGEETNGSLKKKDGNGGDHLVFQDGCHII